MLEPGNYIAEFQSTHPGGVRLKFLDRSYACSFGFQSTHPGGVRPRYCIRQPTTKTFQSTHPGGVRPRRCNNLRLLRQISIHAPGWGATRGPRQNRRRKTGFQSTHPGGVRLPFIVLSSVSSWISIHAPGWGATFSPEVFILPRWNFNPRTRVGCDSSALSPGSADIISIHAPGWGAT